MEFIDLLNMLAVPNYDNGREFVVRDRLDAVARALESTNYKKVNNTGLFELYAINGELPSEAVLVSTHIDCVRDITDFYARESDNEHYHGTFDNLITNGVILDLMLQGKLRENVIVAFTGNEEEDSRGACQVTEFLKNRNCDFVAVILDVTDMGWDKDACFSVENNFWTSTMGRAVICTCENDPHNWVFVPSDVEDIPAYIPGDNLIREEALCDESWEYDEGDIQCFSFCIPTKGEMHGNKGLFVKKAAVEVYKAVLAKLLERLA